jgi:hypothetical protein
MTLSVSLSLSPSLFLFLSLSRARSVHARFSNVSDKDTAASVPERGAVLRCSASVQGFDPGRCRANMAHIRQSRPDPAPGLQCRYKCLKPFKLFPLCSETACARHPARSSLLPARSECQRPSDPELQRHPATAENLPAALSFAKQRIDCKAKDGMLGRKGAKLRFACCKAAAAHIPPPIWYRWSTPQNPNSQPLEITTRTMRPAS